MEIDVHDSISITSKALGILVISRRAQQLLYIHECEGVQKKRKRLHLFREESLSFVL